ncbi:MAG: lipid-A-disaccharide synthase [Mariprofundales bacterium]|nr:lipid-A-disaccharide synthase [Mariprofundales bacterium]
MSTSPESVRIPRILISAGEASGDMHAAAVVGALLANSTKTPANAVAKSEVVGIAGPAMRAAGCAPWVDMAALGVMGLTDVVRSLPRILAVERTLLARVEVEPPVVAILVDFSSFHMRLGRKLRAQGIPVLHYIAPKLWAWGAWRTRKLAASQDRLASILPFESRWFTQHGIKAEYVGNPVACRSHLGWSRDALCQRAGLETNRRILAVLPGSRTGELTRHVALLAEVVQRLRQQDDHLQVVVPQAPGVDAERLQPLREVGAVMVDRMAEGFALRVDAAVAVSGTATLELALWQTPTVLVYRSSWLTMWLGRKLVHLRCVGLANILLDDTEVMPELIQEQATPERIVAELMPLLSGGEAARRQRTQFAHLAEMMGSQDPAMAVAEMCWKMVVPA